jgi:hypothetical protein
MLRNSTGRHRAISSWVETTTPAALAQLALTVVESSSVEDDRAFRHHFPMQNCIMGWKARGCWGSARWGLMCTCMYTRKDLSASSS